jgi:hypothetical protein
MNLKKLTTLLFAGVTAATPFATNAQNPTILQGNYVSNVFGQANFVLNPNAQTNVANVTVTNATRTRSTTTPLVATTEFNVTVTSANGTATWATRSFDAGMKNQNCEARFTYRGFQSTSKAQIKQGANVVAELTLTPSATDPRIASINFPCGDLSAATTFVITDTATLSGIHEIGGIYVGLATNQANVAQAEYIGYGGYANGGSIAYWEAATNESALVYAVGTPAIETSATSIIPAPVGGTNKLEIRFNNLKPGRYMALFVGPLHKDNASVTGNCSFKLMASNANTGVFIGDSDGESFTFNLNTYGKDPTPSGNSLQKHFSLTSTTNVNLTVYTGNATGVCRSSVGATTGKRLRINLYRFPSSSELVVTPETQNVWGASTYAGTTFGPSYFSGTVAPTSYTTISDPGFTSRRTLKGKCKAPISGDDVGCRIENMPVGNYKVSFSGLMYEKNPVVGGRTVCNYEIYETTLSNTIASRTSAEMRTVSNDQIYRSTSMDGVFTNSSIANRNFVIRTKKGADINTGDVGTCSLFVGDAASTDHTTVDFIIEPLDNNSNSALYVQGPVKAGNTGTAAPTGYIGEVINSTSATSGTVSTGVNTATRMTITLTPGTWLLHGGLRFNSNVTYNFNQLSISSSTAVDPGNSIQPQPAVAGSWNTHANLSRVVTVTSNVTFYLVTLTWIPSGSATYDNATFTATRIGSN